MCILLTHYIRVSQGGGEVGKCEGDTVGFMSRGNEGHLPKVRVTVPFPGALGITESVHVYS